MTRITPASLTDVEDPEIQEIANELIGYKGFIPDHYRLEGVIPDLLKHIWHAQESLYEEGPLSREMLRKIGVAVSMANDCTYCTGAYCSLLSSDFDGTDEVLDFQSAIRDGSLPESDAAIIDFATKVNDDPSSITDADVDTLKDEFGLSDQALLQIVYQVNLVSGYNRVTIVFDAEYDHNYPRTLAAGDG